MKKNPAGLDWDAITKAQGFRVGDNVRYRGPDIGTIQHIIKPARKYRAHVYWPTKPHFGEARSDGTHEFTSPSSEQFVDLDKLTKVRKRKHPKRK